MTNKMATKHLSYELGSLSYDDSKLAKWKNKDKEDRLLFLKPGLWQVFFGSSEEWYHFQ